MLSSVGATKKQKRNSVFFEGALIGLISIPIGILSGLSGIGITFWSINSMLQDALRISEKLVVVVTPLSILSACVVSIATIFISTYLPARRASRISAIDAIRQTEDIKLTNKAVKTSKLVRKLFGIEAEIGLKNLKRNNRRYVVTVFSLVVSIVLFLVVSFFSTNLEKSLSLSQKGINFDIQVFFGNEIDDKDQKLKNAILSLDGVTDSSVNRELMTTSWIEEEFIAAELQSRLKEDQELLNEGKYPYYIKVHSLDEESLKAYAQETGANYEELNHPEKLSAIVIDTASYVDLRQDKYTETKAIQARIGQTLDLSTKKRMKSILAV